MMRHCFVVVLNLLFFCVGLTFLQAQDKENMMTDSAQAETAYFAGGCFWCMENDFSKLKGVQKVLSGYTGGEGENPRYEQVSAGGTGHYESVEVIYDPQSIRYEDLLVFFWRNIDPFDPRGQFCDQGSSYRAAIFYKNEKQKQLALESKERVEKQLGKSVVTEILPSKRFYPAEEYHQDYAQKNPIRYWYYRSSCGRDQRLKDVWGEPPHEK